MISQSSLEKYGQRGAVGLLLYSIQPDEKGPSTQCTRASLSDFMETRFRIVCL